MIPTLLTDPDRLLAALSASLALAGREYPSSDPDDTGSTARLVTSELWATRIATATNTHPREWWGSVHDTTCWLDVPGGEADAKARANVICARAAGLVGRRAA